MKKTLHYLKRIFAMTLALILALETFSGAGEGGLLTLVTQAAEAFTGPQIDNGYIKVTISEKNGGFGIRTIEGDKINKDDNNKYLLFEYDEDNTSFTSFRVTRNGETKEYIFGGKYPGSSEVKVSKESDVLIAVWSVDDLTFTQKISLVATGANEHGTAYINYTVENAGAPAEVKCRMLMDTALGYQDYGHYKLGDDNLYTERETTIDASEYNKVFYAVDNVDYPSITAYTINAAIDNQECKPYQVTFAHWNNLAASVFDYEIDENMTFVNAYNKEYLTADSAVALYYDMGEVAKDGFSVVGTNYGIFSNEAVSEKATTSVNVVAPDVLDYAKDAQGNEIQSAYENEGIFTVRTFVENFSDVDYEKVRIVVYATGGIDPLNQSKEPSNSTYDNPYYLEINEFNAGEKQDIDWYFKAEPMASGQYAKVHYKVYDVSDDATLGTGALMTENLLGEGSSYILCPGSVDKVPKIKFTGTSPETIYTEGYRNLYLTGENFSLLLDTSAYELKLRRADGFAINGSDSVTIPTEYIKIDDYKNTITLTLTDDIPGKLAEGMYQMTLDYTDELIEDITGQALSFQVVDDVKYKNDTYGFLAVIKDKNSSPTGDTWYTIRHFMSEEDYQTEVREKRVVRDDVILEFRGLFTKNDENPEDAIVSYEGLSLGDNDNVMVLNDCMDIKNGTVTIKEDNHSVTVDFEADIYTTGAGTFVWSGVAALTELEAGTDYGLIPYDENGNRQGFDHEVIALMWPSVGQTFQNLMGLLFDFKYGELGVIKHGDDPLTDTRLAAFGASMDLSFIIPDANPSYSGRTKDYLGSSYDAAEHVKFSPEEVRAMNKRAGGHNIGTANTEASSWQDNYPELGTDMGGEASGGDGDSKSACIQIDDILFGGKYLGVNMALALGIPGYVDGMPALESLLTIRTVGDWSFSVGGVCNFEMFYLEGNISIMSKNGIPIPDSLTFFLGGCVPGINIDTVGVLWLQGAGGGIENLYDTIFLTDAIPPLKLILEAQFSLMQVISAKASLGLSLRGIDVTLSNGKLANAIPVLNYATIDLDWYPEFYFMGGAEVSILDAISGTGYIVVEDDGFFEFFIRALLQIPGSIPVVGGLDIAGANMGLNMDKVWGQIEIMNIGLGVSYFWGGDIDWNSGSKVYPTYPELAGMERRSALIAPIGFDVKANEMVYAAVGTNFTTSAATATAADVAPIDEGIGDVLKTTDLSLATEHTLQLVANGNSKMMLIEWEADSKEQAYLDVVGDEAADKAGVSIVNLNATGNQPSFYEIKLLDHTVDANAEANEGANANFTYNEETKMASLAVTFTKAEAFGPTWTVYTPEGSAIVLYDVAPLPQLTQPEAADVTVAENGLLTVKVNGTQLEKFTNLSFVAENADGESVMLYRLDGAVAQLTKNAISFKVPDELSSGTYSLHMTAWDDQAQFYSEVETEFTYVNKNQPQAPVVASATGVGDYMVQVNFGEQTAEEFAGYAITAYDSEGNPVSGVSDMMFYKDGTAMEYNEDGTVFLPEGTETSSEFVIGGHYEYPYTDPETNEETTIVGGFSEGDYTISVKKWKLVKDGTAVLYSDAATTEVHVKAPVKTKIDVTAELPEGTKSQVVTIVQKEATAAEEEISYQQTMYNASEITLILSSDMQSFNGRWELDGGTKEGTSGKIEGLTKEVKLSFEGLEDGTHTLEFFGKNQYGDATSVKHVFGVDTQGPRLLMSAPINGSFFDYWTGKLAVSGITDSDVTLTIVDETTGKTVYTAETVEVDEFGHFDIEVTLDRTILEHTLTLKASDALGNSCEKQVTVVSDGLGSIEKLLIFAGDKDVTNQKMTAGTANALKLMAKLKRPENAETTEELYVEVNQANLVDWQQTVVAGTATITDNQSGILHQSEEGAEGMITAAFLVNDAGAYTVCTAFGETGSSLIDLEDTAIKVEDAFYTGSEVTAKVEITYDDQVLVEGTDYQLSYRNNVNLSAGAKDKPTVVITGLGQYAGTVTEEFEIVYLPAEDGMFEISGTEGNKTYYRSDVEVKAADGYELLKDLDSMLEASLTFTEEGIYEVEFYVRRLRDGAITDKVVADVKVDKTPATGIITMKENIWSKFLTIITFGIYDSGSQVVTITAEDTISGVDKIQYVISDVIYGSVEDLEASEPEWKDYNNVLKPSVENEGSFVVYAKIRDKAGNISYLSSDGVVIDETTPVIVGIKDGKTYSGQITFTVEDANLDKVLVDGKAIEAVDGKYTLQADGKDRTIEAVDKAGNSTKYTIKTNASLINLEDTTVKVEDAFYTGSEVTAKVEITYDDQVLVEGTDYQLSYQNNVNLSAGAKDKPMVVITGLGQYAGTVTEEFEIIYLPAEDGMFEISGTEGNKTYYRSDVEVKAADGYELLKDLDSMTEASLTFTEEGIYEVEFYVRRLRDSAITDKVVADVKVDKTPAIGIITMKENIWSKFLTIITFGIYDSGSQVVTITAEDAISGVDKIQYVISDVIYGSVEDLEASEPEWKDYDNVLKPSVENEGSFVVYAKIRDKAGNISYLSSDGVVIDETAPVIVGIKDGKTYSGQITFTVEDANLDKVLVDGKASEAVDGKYTLQADGKDRTIEAVDKAGNSTKYTIKTNKSVTEIFSDVYNDWYTGYVQYVYDNSLMTGIKGTTRFEPNANITKAQVAQVLYNMESQPAITDQKVFKELKDVYAAEWYANAVAWAYNTGVVTGDLNTKKFNPNADVSREQLALMMYRYAQYKAYDTSATSDLKGLKNAENTANWALDGVKWAVGAGLISGVEKNGVKDLAPQGNASRAQVAAILQRFCENVK